MLAVLPFCGLLGWNGGFQFFVFAGQGGVFFGQAVYAGAQVGVFFFEIGYVGF